MTKLFSRRRRFAIAPFLGFALFGISGLLIGGDVGGYVVSAASLVAGVVGAFFYWRSYVLLRGDEVRIVWGLKEWSVSKSDVIAVSVERELGNYGVPLATPVLTLKNGEERRLEVLTGFNFRNASGSKRTQGQVSALERFVNES